MIYVCWFKFYCWSEIMSNAYIKNIIFISFFSNCAFAENVQMFSDHIPTADELGSIIFSNEQVQATGFKTRSLKFIAKSSAKTNKELLDEAAESTTVGLPISFDFNSAELSESSFKFLNEIGKMMVMKQFSKKKLLIEGHTDAKGSLKYNQNLSEKRAVAVKKYLRTNYQIEETRLSVVGLGENEFLVGTSPYDGINRRVQFRKQP